ncbi:MAG: hypothetical protein ACRENF_06905, partial [Thermodesulfobacteriota bacterium]
TDLKRRVPHSQEHAFYTYFGKECFFHLACVTAGLDSAMLAESDIQRQVKKAYEETRAVQSLSAPLHYVFQKSLKLGKMVRSSFPLFQTTLRLEGLIYQLIEKVLGESSNLLFIGNSDINRKIIHYCWRKGKRKMTLCTRDLDSAQPFALDYHLSLKDRSELLNWPEYDGVIAATPSPTYLITERPETCSTRLILDLSIPRCVDPSLKRTPDLVLLNMEELGNFFESYHAHRKTEVQAIKATLQEGVDKSLAIYEQKTLINSS